MARAGLKKVVKSVKGKRGSVKRTYWVRAGEVAHKHSGKIKAIAGIAALVGLAYGGYRAVGGPRGRADAKPGQAARTVLVSVAQKPSAAEERHRALLAPDLQNPRFSSWAMANHRAESAQYNNLDARRSRAVAAVRRLGHFGGPKYQDPTTRKERDREFAAVPYSYKFRELHKTRGIFYHGSRH